jgi:cytoskeletal protein CcmA (bactofilin family)
LSDTHVTDDAFINSIIGEGTKFKGEFDLNGLLRIDGDFTGIIRTKGKVLVGKNGRAECTLNAGTVVILSTGLVLGNITTPRLIVEEGVIFNGSCRITALPPTDNGHARANGQKMAAAPLPAEAVVIQGQKH